MLTVINYNVNSQNWQHNCSKIKLNKIIDKNIKIESLIEKFDGDTISFIKCLEFLINDSTEYEISNQLINTIWNISDKSMNLNVKTQSISFFIKSLDNIDVRISSKVIRYLTMFNKNIYSTNQVRLLESKLKSNASYSNLVILLGYVGNISTIDSIKQIFPNSRKFSKNEIWATYKALARLGDGNSIDYCVKKISTFGINDEVVDYIFPDLAYISQQKSFDVLIEAILSDEASCSSLNPNSDFKIICAYRVLELLAPRLKNFSINLLPSGDLNVTDYSNALENARKWLSENRNQYQINTEIF